MKALYTNIISFFLLLSFNSCIFIHDQGYKGLATTTLSGHILINNSNCFVSSAIPEIEDPDKEWPITAVINLETSGDKYITLCLTESNYPYYFNTPPLPFQSGGIAENIKLTFYASDEIAEPGSSNIGNTSEVLLFGINPSNTYQIAEFELLGGGPCQAYFNNELRPGIFLGELDLSLLQKKPYIVARVADCGNFPLGTASNPLVSEKKLPK